MGCELAEDEGAVMVGMKFGHELHEPFQLGGWNVERGFYEAYIADRQPQTRDFGQSLHGGGGIVFHFGDGLLTDIVVESPFLGRHLYLKGDFGLFRKFAEHFALRAA